MKFAVLLILFLASSSFAAIPRGLLILQKTSDNNGSGIYQIEQEVQFQSGNDSLLLKETWLVENENYMRVLVQGTKDTKEKISFVTFYSGGQRQGPFETGRVSKDFIEKYFHFRNVDNFANELIQDKIVPAAIFSKKAFKPGKENDYSGEDFVKLGRTGGVIAYTFGTPAADGTHPGLWIEQDQFVIRKLRLPSQAEVTAEKYGSYSRGLNFPRYRSVRWGANQVQITTLSVVGKGKEALSSISSKMPAQLDGIYSSSLKSTVEEFYKRFR